MSAEYMHIGIPVTNRKPGMVHNEGAGFGSATSMTMITRSST